MCLTEKATQTILFTWGLCSYHLSGKMHMCVARAGERESRDRKMGVCGLCWAAQTIKTINQKNTIPIYHYQYLESPKESKVW